MISGFLSPQHGTFSGCRWRGWSPEVEGSSHYIEKAVADGGGCPQNVGVGQGANYFSS